MFNNNQNPYQQPQAYSQSRKSHGLAWILAFFITLILFISASGFGLWAFMERQDYKDNVDAKIETAVKVAEQKTSTAKDNEFAEKEKSPFKEYTGPATYGSLKFQYPKTWSAYVVENGTSQPLDAYFHPNQVPGVQNKDVTYALRAQVVNQAYDVVLKSFDAKVKSGAVKVTTFTPTGLTNTVGVRVDGEIETKKTGSMVLIQLRDKTIKVWTESNLYTNDFNNSVLPNLTFSP
jgi:hypothetical protein